MKYFLCKVTLDHPENRIIHQSWKNSFQILSLNRIILWNRQKIYSLRQSQIANLETTEYFSLSAIRQICTRNPSRSKSIFHYFRFMIGSNQDFEPEKKLKRNLDFESQKLRVQICLDLYFSDFMATHTRFAKKRLNSNVLKFSLGTFYDTKFLF